MSKENQKAEESDTILRISMDAKARIKIGLYSRGGKSRVPTKALDHDFAPEQVVTPFGFFLPGWNDSYIFLTESKVTSDFIVDCMIELWRILRDQFPKVKTILLNLDNGGENSSSRTQFMKRIVEFSHIYGVNVILAYYPPYHSKYNPIERVWGVAENYWNGSLLDSVEAVEQTLMNMTYNGISPKVIRSTKEYQTGVTLTKEEMKELEKQYQRLSGLSKWFVYITAPT